MNNGPVSDLNHMLTGNMDMCQIRDMIMRQIQDMIMCLIRDMIQTTS